MQLFIVYSGFLLYFVIYFSEADSNAWNKNHEIRDKLLKNYDKLSLPQRNANGTTDVQVKMVLKSLWLDDNTQILTVTALIVMIWTDERLQWIPANFDGLGMVHLGDGEIWKPDLYVYNNAKESNVDPYSNVHFLVYSSGMVFWVPPAHMEVNCAMDLKYWPFDEHICDIIVGSWTSHGLQINLQLFSNITKIDLSEMSSSTNSWKILDATEHRLVTVYACCKEPYMVLLYRFRLKRYSPTFAGFVVVPAVVLPLFLLVQFILPVDNPKRISISCCCAVLVLLEILYLKYSLPKLGTNVPLIVSYYSQLFITAMVTAAISATLGRIAHPQNPLLAFPPPEMLKRILTGIPATVLCLRNHANQVGLSGKMAEDGEVLETSKTPTYAHEWLFVAKFADRIASILLICLFFLSLICYVSPIE